MASFNLLRIFVVLFILFISSLKFAYALYPEADGYPYKKNIVDLYVGASYSGIVSETFRSINGPKAFGYGSIIDPLNQMTNSGFTAILGMRFFDNGNSFVKNLRVEVESLYLYNQTPIINNSSKYTSDMTTTDWPTYGQEVLKSSVIFNVYYDFRQWSEIFYPYIGFGIGMGNVKYIAIDINELPNGVGERYHGDEFVPVGQLAFGFQYDTKIIKSSFYFQYRVVKSGKVNAVPYNNGRDFVIEPEPDTNNPDAPVENPIPEGYQDPTSHKLGLLNHGLSIGFKYYIY